MAGCTWGGGGQGQCPIRRNLSGAADRIHSPLKSIYGEHVGNPHSNFPWKNPSQREALWFIRNVSSVASIGFHLALIMAVAIDH